MTFFYLQQKIFQIILHDLTRIQHYLLFNLVPHKIDIIQEEVIKL